MYENKIEVVRVKSWDDFTSNVFSNTLDDRINRFRSSFAYRGVSNEKYDLKSSLMVNCSEKLDLEDSLIRNFKKYGSLEIKDQNNIWEVLALAQHHGLPTRLLDWTFSPFVAAHFATENTASNEDGVVWCVNIEDCKNSLPDKLGKELEAFGGYTFTVDLLKKIMNEDKELNNMMDKCGNQKNEPYIIFLEPPSIDSRIVNQYGLFSIMSHNDICLNDYILDSKNSICLKKIIIPVEIKKEIRDKLDQINLNERVIYPGLDGLCKWLGRHYMDSSKMYNK